jgi:hypothetical protein
MGEITHSYLSTLDCCFAVVRANGFSTCNTWWSSCKLLEARAKVRFSRSRLSSWSSIVTHKSDRSMAQHGLCKSNCLQKLLERGSWGFNPPLLCVGYLDELVLDIDEDTDRTVSCKDMRNAKSWLCSDVGWSSFCKGVFFSSLVIWSSSFLHSLASPEACREPGFLDSNHDHCHANHRIGY